MCLLRLSMLCISATDFPIQTHGLGDYYLPQVQNKESEAYEDIPNVIREVDVITRFNALPDP